MPEYKTQHYLPKGYLRFFASGGSEEAPMVWRVDKTSQRLVPVRSQCAEDYHYSKQNSKEAEQEFWSSEEKYCNAVRAIAKGSIPAEHEAGGLVISMFTLQLRNPVYVNSTGREGIEAYRRRFWTFLEQVLLKHHKGKPSREVLQTELSLNWGMRIFAAPKGRNFITSDNPSVWTCVFGGPNEQEPSSNPLQLVSLPITPTHLAIAYDKTALYLATDQLQDEDYLTLNNAQLVSANRCVYAAQQLPPDLEKIVQEAFVTREISRPVTTGEKCELRAHRLQDGHRFSFVRRTPPLM